MSIALALPLALTTEERVLELAIAGEPSTRVYTLPKGDYISAMTLTEAIAERLSVDGLLVTLKREEDGGGLRANIAAPFPFKLLVPANGAFDRLGFAETNGGMALVQRAPLLVRDVVTTEFVNKSEATKAANRTTQAKNLYGRVTDVFVLGRAETISVGLSCLTAEALVRLGALLRRSLERQTALHLIETTTDATGLPFLAPGVRVWPRLANALEATRRFPAPAPLRYQATLTLEVAA